MTDSFVRDSYRQAQQPALQKSQSERQPGHQIKNKCEIIGTARKQALFRGSDAQ
jgi:hypothetical protein